MSFFSGDAERDNDIIFTAQKMKFSIKDFFSKCDQIRSFLQTWSISLVKFSLRKTSSFVLCFSFLLENRLVELNEIWKSTWKEFSKESWILSS